MHRWSGIVPRNRAKSQALPPRFVFRVAVDSVPRRDRPQPAGAPSYDELVPAAGSTDDVAVLAYRHPEGPPGELATSLAGDPRQLAALRRSVRAWLVPLALDEGLIGDLMVAVNEAASNAIEHGCGLDVGKTVQITARVTGDELAFQITDPGVFIERRERSLNRVRGLSLMRALMDDVQIGTTGETTVRLVRRLCDVH